MDNILAELFDTKRVGSSPELAKFFGSHNTSILFQQLIFWHSKSKYKHNYFWNDYANLAEQLAMTPRQIRYQISKLTERNLIIHSQGKKPNSTNTTNWFRVNLDQFRFEFGNYLNDANSSYPQEIAPVSLEFIGSDKIVAGCDKIVAGCDKIVAGGDKIVIPLIKDTIKDIIKDIITPITKNQFQNNFIDESKADLFQEQIPDHYERTAVIHGGRQINIPEQWQKFLMHQMSVGKENIPDSRRLGEWGKWIMNQINYIRANPIAKKSNRIDNKTTLDINDTSWADNLTLRK